MTNKTKLKKIFSRKPKKTAEELNSELITASCNSDVKQVAKLLQKHNLDVNFQCKKWHGRTALLYATNMNIANLLIDAGADVNAKDNFGYTALHRVSKVDIAKLLIEAGADINAKTKFGSTPLGCAKQSLGYLFSGQEDFLKVVKFLEDRVNTKSNKIKFIDRGGITTKGISSSRS